jgi:GNAT superfamily N-acetyltransferase
MARRLDGAGPEPACHPGAEVVPQVAVHDLWESSWRRELAGTVADLDEVVGQLVGREHRNDRVVRVVDLAVRVADEVVAAGQLRVDGATAAVESVLTDPAARGRGYADAVLARAVVEATRAGCDLVVLDAAALDWRRTGTPGGASPAWTGAGTSPGRPLRPGRRPTARGRRPPPRAAGSPSGPSGHRGRAAGRPCP